MDFLVSTLQVGENFIHHKTSPISSSRRSNSIHIFSMSTDQIKEKVHNLITSIFEIENNRLKHSLLKPTTERHLFKTPQTSRNFEYHNQLFSSQSILRNNTSSKKNKLFDDLNSLIIIDSQLTELQRLLQELKLRQELDLIILVRAS
jgi:hypothetical protein